MGASVERFKSQRATSTPLAFAGLTGLELQGASRAHLRWYAVLLVVWLVGCSYAGWYLMRGWVPHDEGAFAQSADRVLHGEMPHRDYAEIYTGGLAYLNAAAFRYLGEKLATLRIVLFAFFAFWIPVFYWIASRFVSDWLAGGITLLAVAWSLPNYSAAVPSWYNLFFATFGLAAVLMYLTNRSTRWLYFAGVSGGLSFLAKNGALYYVAGMFLFFLFCEQDLSCSRANSQRGCGHLYSGFLVLLIILFLGALVILLLPHASVERTLNFVIPSAALAAVVLARESGPAGQPSRQRLRVLLSVCIPFALGFLVPVLLFFLVFVHGGGQRAFLEGVFILPFKRVSNAFMDPPNITTAIPPLCLAGLLGLAAWLRGAAKWILVSAAAVAGTYLLASSAHNMTSYRVMWHTAYWATPFLAITGGYVLWPRVKEPPADCASQQRLFLILSVGSICGLIQYPFSAPIYFCYDAPLVILVGVATLLSFPSIPRYLLALMFICFLMFAVLRVTPPFIYAMGSHYQADPETQPLKLARASNLRVEPWAVQNYGRLIPLIQTHAGGGGIYAGPDCPEVYFLSGYPNPGRALFEFLEPDEGNSAQLLRIVQNERIRVVVLNTAPSFSSLKLSPEVRGILARRFPNREKIGQFVTFWHD